MKKWKEREKEHWNEMLPHEKVFYVVSMVVLTLMLIVFVFTVLFGISIDAGVLTINRASCEIIRGLTALYLLCQAMTLWRRQRGIAIPFMFLGIWWGIDTIWEIVKLFI